MADGALYRTRDGDMLDVICKSWYGESSRYTEAVLEANPGLADLGPVLPSGVVIELPEFPGLSVKPGSVRLWD
jgi:phage tail protein X